MATAAQVWIKQGEFKDDKTRVFKTFRIDMRLWSVSYGSGVFPEGFTHRWPARELALNTNRYISKGNHPAEVIRQMYARWQSRVEKAGFTFKGTVKY